MCFNRKAYMKCIFLLVLILHFSCSPRKKDETAGKRDKGIIEAEAVVVNGRALEHTFSFAGNLLAWEEVEIRPEIQARVVQVGFKEGQMVEKGQLLCKLDDAELQAQWKKNKIAQQLASSEEARVKEMLKLEAVSQEEYDVAMGKLQSLQADGEYIEAQIKKTELRAPFGGLAGFRDISVGAVVNSSVVITKLWQTNKLRVEFFIPEKILPLLQDTKDIGFSVSGNEDWNTATIYAMEPGLDLSTRSLRVRAEFQNKDLKILPGAIAEIKLVAKKREKSVVVPSKALIPILDGESILLVRNGKCESLKIISGLRTATEVEVLNGLVAGDTVLTTALLQLKPGMPVRAIVKLSK